MIFMQVYGYIGDEDCYHDFDGKHVSNMNGNDISGNINKTVPVKSTRIRVGRNIEGYGLSPGILKKGRLAVRINYQCI